MGLRAHVGSVRRRMYTLQRVPGLRLHGCHSLQGSEGELGKLTSINTLGKCLF